MYIIGARLTGPIRFAFADGVFADKLVDWGPHHLRRRGARRAQSPTATTLALGPASHHASQPRTRRNAGSPAPLTK